MPLKDRIQAAGGRYGPRVAPALRSLFTNYLRIQTILGLALLALVLHFTGVITLPFAPFATTGLIYVDSPEVYTRERLVNDRYDQDHWLRQQLEDLDGAENLLTAQLDRRIAVNTKDDVAGAGAGEPREELLPFDQEFRIRAAVRDTIRQLMLENMLDDRHDLTGNSVYGLKFDTTVIPGASTRRRAFVRVRLEAPEPFDPALAEPGEARLPRFITAYYGPADEWDPLAGGNAALAEAYERYKDWLENIESRLNNQLLLLYNYTGERCGADNPVRYIDDISRRAIELVIGAPSERVTIRRKDAVEDEAERSESQLRIEQDSVELGEPWSRYMRIDRSRQIGDVSKACERRPLFRVSQVWDPVFYSEKSTASAWGMPLELFYGDGKVHLFNTRELGMPRYDLTTVISDLLALVQEHGRAQCLDQNMDGDCEDGDDVRYITMPSGLFNFIADVAASDAYSYAIFPRNDVVGILKDTQLAAETPTGELPILFRLVQDLREAQTASVLVGYGDGDRGGEEGHGSVEFGWVISGRGDMEPTQKAQMALVSVPAWASALHLRIEVGWLNRDSSEDVDRDFPLTVPLPSTIEAFDSLLRGRKIPRAPKVLDDFMDDERITVAACEPARLLIPGLRLWRSASVTLGAQKADRITVLPDMEGLIAYFDPVEVPTTTIGEAMPRWGVAGPPDSMLSPAKNACGMIPEAQVKERSVCARLRVWTSEGVDRVEKGVRVMLPETGRCDRREPAVGRTTAALRE